MKVVKLELPVFQTVRKYFTWSIDYWNYRITICSPKFDDMSSSYIAKLVKKVITLIKARILDPKHDIASIGFSEMFRIVWNRDSIHDGTAMWILPYYVT